MAVAWRATCVYGTRRPETASPASRTRGRCSALPSPALAPPGPRPPAPTNHPTLAYLTLIRPRLTRSSPPLWAAAGSGVGGGLETQRDLGTAVGRREGWPERSLGTALRCGTGPGPSTTHFSLGTSQTSPA